MIEIVWTNNKKKAKHMRDLSGRVGTVHATRWGEAVSETGEESVNYTILSGGKHPTKKGGPRILTERMIDSKFSDSKNSGGLVTARAGYKNPPKHTIFQEYGTRDKRVSGGIKDLDGAAPGGSGIAAMLSIAQAIQDMEMSAESAGMKTLIKIAKEWDSYV